METPTICKYAKEMETRDHLLALVNILKKDELQEKFKPFTRKQMGYYCNPNHTFHRYRSFEIPKKSGAKRQISAPYSQAYLYLLRYVNLILQSVHIPSTHAMGFINGRGIVDNAAVHRGMNYVFNIDLKDFFPSIERKRIVRRLQLKPFCFTKDVSLAIGGLCCMRVEDGEDENGQKRYKYVLPQGSPSSPTLTNIVCDKLDFLLAAVARRFHLNYTRYADDITFSSMHNVYHDGSDFRLELARIIAEQGFTINERKTRLCCVGSRQEVTGLTVSRNKINVARNYIAELRNTLYIWERYGYGAAETKLHEYNWKNHPDKRIGIHLDNVVSGKLMFLKMVKGETDSTYIKLYARFSALMDKMSQLQPKRKVENGIKYLETMPVPNFEHLWKVKAEMKKGQCVDGGDATDVPNGRYVEFTPCPECGLGWASVLRTTPVNKPLKELSISLCEDGKGHRFLMVHVPYKSTHIPDKVNLEQLNYDLDTLLNAGEDTVIDLGNLTELVGNLDTLDEGSTSLDIF